MGKRTKEIEEVLDSADNTIQQLYWDEEQKDWSYPTTSTLTPREGLTKIGMRNKDMQTAVQKELEAQNKPDYLDKWKKDVLDNKGASKEIVYQSGDDWGQEYESWWKNKKWTQWYCEHWREKINILNGLSVFASSWADRPTVSWKPTADPGYEGLPDIGIYFSAEWIPPGKVLTTPGMDLPEPLVGSKQTIIFPWPDYGVPQPIYKERLMYLLLWVLEQLKQGKIVEFGCHGAHGRTGGAIASLLVLQGMKPSKAIKKLRKVYCEQAVETFAQEKFIVEMHRMWRKEKKRRNLKKGGEKK